MKAAGRTAEDVHFGFSQRVGLIGYTVALFKQRVVFFDFQKGAVHDGRIDAKDKRDAVPIQHDFEALPGAPEVSAAGVDRASGRLIV